MMYAPAYIIQKKGAHGKQPVLSIFDSAFLFLFYHTSNLIYSKLLRDISRKTVRFMFGQKFLRLPEIAGIISIP